MANLEPPTLGAPAPPWGPAPPHDAAAPRRRPQRVWLHVLLFGLTFVSATWSQSVDLERATSLTDALLGPFLQPSRLLHGLTFAVTLMSILLAHEMGHYLTARRHGVDQTLPFFIPAPTFFGTLGAVILMRSQPPDRTVLMRVAVMGPYAGLVLAIPAAAWGLSHSIPVPPGLDMTEATWFGESLLWQGLAALFGPESPNVIVHPVGMAAWVGLFVTSLNLIPAAQLDGGHVAYALLGRRHAQLSRFVVLALFALGVTVGARNPNGYVWVIWAALLYFMGLRHPPVRDETAPVPRTWRVAGWAALVIFVLTFIPVPITLPQDVAPRSQPGRERSGDEAPSPLLPAEEFRL